MLSVKAAEEVGKGARPSTTRSWWSASSACSSFCWRSRPGCCGSRNANPTRAAARPAVATADPATDRHRTELLCVTAPAGRPMVRSATRRIPRAVTPPPPDPRTPGTPYGACALTAGTPIRESSPGGSYETPSRAHSLKPAGAGRLPRARRARLRPSARPPWRTGWAPEGDGSGSGHHLGQPRRGRGNGASLGRALNLGRRGCGRSIGAVKMSSSPVRSSTRRTIGWAWVTRI